MCHDYEMRVLVVKVTGALMAGSRCDDRCGGDEVWSAPHLDTCALYLTFFFIWYLRTMQII